tara:strand:+ start:283 stop:498 length:216 start_codon:yes stop_codon:yes gene_type:complete
MGDNDFPAVMANGGSWENAHGLASQWKRRSSGSSASFSSGLGLPTTGEQAAYESGDGSDEDPWFTEERRVF